MRVCRQQSEWLHMHTAQYWIVVWLIGGLVVRSREGAELRGKQEWSLRKREPDDMREEVPLETNLQC